MQVLHPLGQIPHPSVIPLLTGRRKYPSEQAVHLSLSATLAHVLVHYSEL